MTHAFRARAAGLLAILALAFFVVASADGGLSRTRAAAAGVVVKPIDQSIVDRVGKVVPLDASGSQVAFSASRSGSQYLGDAIYIANADGSNMRRVGVLNGRSDYPVYELAVSKDYAWLAYQSYGQFVTDSGAVANLPKGIGIVNVATGTLRRVPWRGDEAAILAGRSWFYVADLNQGAERAIVRIDAPTGRVRNVRLVGNGASTPVRIQGWITSENRQEAGFCSTIRSPSSPLRLGLLDRDMGVVRTTADASLFQNGCQVSDDGSTVAAVGSKKGVRRLVALRHGRKRVISLGRGLSNVVALSPSGRYAVVLSGDISPVTSERVALVDLDHKVVHVLRGVRSLTGYNDTASAIWSNDEQTAVFVTPTWRKAGGVFTLVGGRLVAVSTKTGSARFLARPVAPAGMPFNGAPVPQAFTDDGQAIGVTVPTDVSGTDAVPYRVPLNGSPATLLFSNSIRSFGTITRSPDRSHAWISAGWTCSSTYRFPMMYVASGDPWSGPWQTGNP